MARKETEQTKHPLPRKQAAAGVAKSNKPAAAPVVVPAPPKINIVGFIYHADSNPVAGISITVRDKGLRTSALLAKTVTDEKGHYEFSFSPAKFKLNPANPVVQIEVQNKQGKVIASSDLLDVKTDNEANFVIDSPDYKGPPAFQNAKLSVGQRVGKVRYSDLAENETRQDITYLANQSGKSVKEVADFVKAQQFAEQTKVPAEVFYALMKQGLPADLETLVTQKTEVVASALEQAVKDNLISESVAKRKTKIMGTLRSAHAERLLNAKPVPGEASLGDILGIALKDTDIQRKVMESYLSAAGQPDEFWNNLKTVVGDEGLAARTRLTLQLAWLTGNQTALIKSLLDEVDPAVDDLRAYAGYDTAAWQQRITEISRKEKRLCVPASIGGKDDREKTRNYAATLARIVKESHPTAVFASRLAQDRNKQNTFAGSKSDMAAFFKNNPDFELTRYPTYTLTSRSSAFKLTGVKDKTKLVQTLQSIQRVFKLVPDYDAVAVLHKDGLTSSFKIAQLSQPGFVKQYAASVGGDAAARSIHQRAVKTYMASLEMFAELHPNLTDSPYVIPGGALNDTSSPGGGQGGGGQATAEPELRTMFGSLEQSDADESQTVYSPAAYLVDILHFLEGCSPEVFQELKRRRGDILDIDLNRSNTETPLPYVDLVLERLEMLSLVLGGSYNVNTLPTCYQTVGTPEALAANPEHSRRYFSTGGTWGYREEQTVPVSAYSALKNAFYPATLPFNQPLEESRVYLAHLGVSRADLMRQFFPVNPSPDIYDPTDFAWAAEYLGISPEEASIIIHVTEIANSIGLWNFYGFNKENGFTPIIDPADSGKTVSGNWLQALSRVDVFLQQTGLQYTEMLYLLDTRYVNPPMDPLKPLGQRKITVVSTDPAHPATSVLGDLKLMGIDADDLNRIQRFIRLWRRLGWKTHELDKAITCFAKLVPQAPTGYLSGQDSLVRIAHTARVARQFNLSVEQSLALWGNFDTSVYTDYDRKDQPELPSLYDTLFCNKAVINPPDSAFDDIRSGIAAAFKDHTATLLAALQITDDDLSLLARTLNVDTGAAGSLHLSMASLLYRYALMARSLGLSIKDFLTAKGVVGCSPFGSPQETFEFVHRLDTVKTSGFSIDQLDYLLRDHYSEDTGIAPTDASVALFLTDLQTKLGKIQLTAAATGQTELAEGRKNLIKQKFTETLKLSPAASRLLLETAVYSPAHPSRVVVDDFTDSSFTDASPAADVIDPTQYPALVQDFRLLHKLGTFVNTLKITDDELPLIINTSVSVRLGITNLAALPLSPTDDAHFDKFEKLIDLAKARDMLPFGTPSLSDIMAPLLQNSATTNPVPAKTNWLNQVEARTHWGSLVTDLVGGGNDIQKGGILKVNFPNDFKDGNLLVTLVKCRDMVKRIGLSANQIAAVNRANLKDTDSKAVKNAAKARHEEADWYSIAKPLQDVLREKQRQALVAYAVARPKPSDKLKWRNINELYEFLLIDVEMSPLMMTSRIKQAISSVQLFVDRVLMNLEYPNQDRSQPPLKLTTEQVEEWGTWRRLYRVWEANRKIFLYPENWIEPQLRDDKSPFFKEVETKLLQNELNADNIEDAFLGYLEKLDSVARLEIKCSYHEVDTANNRDIVHIIGRTFSTPHRYFYRKLENGEWSGWEKVDLDIDGDHLVMSVWNRRLYLFWLVFTKRAMEVPIQMPGGNTYNNYSTTNVSPADSEIGHIHQGLQSADAAPPEDTDEGETLPSAPLYWEIKLAWSERKKNKWLPRNISRTSYYYLVGTTDEGVLNQARARLCVHPEPMAYLYLELYADQGNSTVVDIGGFMFKNGHSDPWDVYNTRTSSLLKNVSVYQNALGQKDPEQGLFLGWSGWYVGATPALSSFPHLPYELVVPGSSPFLGTTLDDAFFFQDDRNTLFAYRPSLSAPSGGSAGSGGGGGGGGGGASKPVRLDPVTVININPYYPKKVIDIAGPVENPGDMIDAVSNPVAEKAGPVMDILDPANTTVVVDGHVFRGGRMLASIKSNAQIKLLNSGSRRSLANTGSGSKGINAQPMPMYGGGGGGGGGGEDIGQTQHPLYSSESRLVFATFCHAHVQTFIDYLNRSGVEGMFKNALQISNLADHLNFFQYGPDPAQVSIPYPTDQVDYDVVGGGLCAGAYSLYNWELLFHLPMLIATRLSTDQRFEDARKWFHYVFDPTCGEGTGKERFWRFKPFNDLAAQPIETLSQLMEHAAELAEQVDRWMQDPFKPHVIARMRKAAYMKNVVMKYLDNLLAWADQLFQRDTIESINEATLLYVLAAKILGERPQRVPPRAEPKVQNYNQLDPNLDAFSNAMVDIELFIPPSAPGSNPYQPNSLGQMAYFCLAKNEKLLGYWDTVADRLFKIRNSMNISGVSRQLPLFEPPIEPGLLVKAAAAGMDLGSILNDLTATLPHYRFSFVLQKAVEMCGEVKALGGALLSALEKKDAEALALLRQSHEMRVLNSARDVKVSQIEEAQANLESLNKAKLVTQARQAYYSSRQFMNQFEAQHLDSIQAGMILQAAQGGIETISSVLAIIPDIKIGAPTGMGATFGGSNLSMALKGASSALGIMVAINNATGQMASTKGGYQRRMDDWKFQADSARKELDQIDKQILASQIRAAIAERELQNHDKQIDNASELNDFMTGKYTNEELYDWMVGQLATAYFQSYQLAYSLAKKAERCYQWELGLDSADSSFVQFGYWDSLRKGLLSGEKLQFDLRRMEASYLENNKREFELTKHVSLALLDPQSLLALKRDGKCSIAIPEVLFDLDYPGHYFRRIKSVSVSMPLIAGPYTTVACTLRLTSHSYRFTPSGSTYPADPFNDAARFRYNTTSQAIATSNAQNDSGVFELNFRDERYVPFEGCGAISKWDIELETDPGLRHFDYDSISDVIIHLKYTAREDQSIKNSVVSHVKSVIEAGVTGANPLPLVRMFSLKHDFSTEWHRFLQPTAGGENKMEFVVSGELFPFFAAQRDIEINNIDFYLKSVNSADTYKIKLTPLVTVSKDFEDDTQKEAGLFTLAPNSTTPQSSYHDKKKPTVSTYELDPSQAWTLRMRRTGATNWKSLAGSDIEDIWMAVSYYLKHEI